MAAKYKVSFLHFFQKYVYLFRKVDLSSHLFFILCCCRRNACSAFFFKAFFSFKSAFSLIGGSDYKLIYRHYATLYFVFCVDSSESELGILDLIQVSCCVWGWLFESNLCFTKGKHKTLENFTLKRFYHNRFKFVLHNLLVVGKILET